MRIFFWLIVVLAIALSGLYGHGTNLPETHKFTLQRTYDQPIEHIWTAVSDYELLPSWADDIESVSELEDSKEIWHVEMEDGHYMDIKVLQSREPYLHMSEIVATDFPFTGTWLFEIAKVSDNKTLLKITEEGRIKKPFWRLMANYVFDKEEAAETFLEELDENLGYIKKTMEARKAAQTEAEESDAEDDDASEPSSDDEGETSEDAHSETDESQ